MIKVFQYWGQGYEKMPKMIKTIYEHNKGICEKFNLELILINDKNVKEYIEPPERFFKLAYNFKSDIIRYFCLHKYGGFWFDTDVIIIKDLNLIVDNLDNKFEVIVDIETETKLGCASLYFKKDTILSKFCVDRINRIIKNSSELKWSILGPCTVVALYQKFKGNMLVNDYSVVRKGCNYICWKDKPGINKTRWLKNTPEEAKKKAESLKNNNDCFYLITWTIYRINNIEGDVSDFVFKNDKSIFSYFINIDHSNQSSGNTTLS